MRKNPFHYAVCGLFLLIVIGIRVAERVTDPNAVNNSGHSLVKLHPRFNLQPNDFQAVKEGMNFDQMISTLRLNDVGDDVRSVANDPHALVVFLNPDGNSLEFMFHDGQIEDKHMYDFQQTRSNEMTRAGERYQEVH